MKPRKMPSLSPAYASIVALLVAVFFMVIGNGILGTLLPLRAKIEGFHPSEIGLLGSAFFAGMLAGALLATRLIQRVGHVRTIAACMVLAACSSLVFSLYVQVWLWLILRFLFGFAFAGLYSGIESWLQGKSSDAIRGRVLGLYSVIQYIGWGLGNQIIGLGDPASFALFSIAALTLCCAIMPLMLSDVDPPEAPATTQLHIRAFYRQSPIGFVGTLLVGAANGCFWSLTPVYASEIGLSVAQVAMYMTVLQVGAGLWQLPVGKLSDRFDRRKVLLGIALANAAFEFWLAMPGAVPGYLPLLGFAFMLGGLVSTQYYVIASHANDRLERTQIVRVSALLLLLFCIGGVVGPLTGAIFQEIMGPAGIFAHNGLFHLALGLFVAHRIFQRPAPVRSGEAEPVKPIPVQ